MSIYDVNFLCREIMRDPFLREALRQNPAETLAQFDLSQDERSALEVGDVGTLYRMGANSFLMGYLARYQMFGLDVTSYGARMRMVDGLGGGH